MTAQKSTPISKPDVSRAIETFLAAGMIWSPDAPSDVAAITDAYYYALDDYTKDQLERGVQHVIRDTRDDARPWIPAANRLRLAIERLDRAAAGPAARPKQGAFVVRAFGIDPLGPLVRSYGEGEATHLPLLENVFCPDGACACKAVEVWVPAAAFGAFTGGWGSRSVWTHVALAKDLKRVADGLPFERAR